MESIGTFKVPISIKNYLVVPGKVDVHLSFKGAHMSSRETVRNCESQVICKEKHDMLMNEENMMNNTPVMK